MSHVRPRTNDFQLFAAAFLSLAVGGCGLILDITDGKPRADTGGSGGDASGGGGGAAAAGGTGAAGAEGGGGSGGAIDVTYYDMTDTTNWTTFVVTAVPGLTGPFQGGTFDGRYLYVGPALSSI